MTIDLAALTKAELLALIPHIGRFVDARDVAAARWDAARAEYDRLNEIAVSLESESRRLDIEGATLPRLNLKDGRREYQRQHARFVASKARLAAERAFRREQKRWKELESYHMRAVK